MFPACFILLVVGGLLGGVVNVAGQTVDVSGLTNAPAQPLAPLQPVSPTSPTVTTPGGPATLNPSVLTPIDPAKPPPAVTHERPTSLLPYLPGSPNAREQLRGVLRRPTPAEQLEQSRLILTQETFAVSTPLPTNTTVVTRLTAPLLFNTADADEILRDIQWFPPDNLWNRNILDWPTHVRSRAIVQSIGLQRALSCNYDMGFVLVPPNQPKVPVKITAYPAESDRGPFPIPSVIPIEGWPLHPRGVTLDEAQRDTQNRGGDRHAIVLDPTNLLLYEFFSFRKTDAGWEAAQASVFDLTSNALRPDGWTSADAAGLPILPGVVRYEELVSGNIDHALRVTVPHTRRAYVAPATHFASSSNDENLPRMGERLRLRPEFNIRPYSPAARTILIAMKQHGLFVADNGNLFAISIAPDSRIPDLADELGRVTAADFEVVLTPP